jgi:hypothetical protein
LELSVLEPLPVVTVEPPPVVNPPEMRRLKGYIARCAKGTRGLITEEFPKRITYPDGTEGLAYVGYHIGPTRIGEPWSSRKPALITATNDKGFDVLMYMIDRARKFKGLK